jgi:uncharacterized protein (DUF433 family)
LTCRKAYNSSMKISKIITSSRDIMGGTPVLAGTRVPVQTLIDCLEAGDSINDFLKGYPSVKRRQVIAFLEHTGPRPTEAR